MSSLGAPGIAEGARRETQVIDSTDSANSSSLNRLAFNATTHCLLAAQSVKCFWNGSRHTFRLGYGDHGRTRHPTCLHLWLPHDHSSPVARGHGDSTGPDSCLCLRTRSPLPSWRSSINLVVVLIPGAMNAGLTTLLFWGSLFILAHRCRNCSFSSQSVACVPRPGARAGPSAPRSWRRARAHQVSHRESRKPSCSFSLMHQRP